MASKPVKPNFFVIGAPKCGTTSLCDLLAQHPDIYFCPDKEPRFFSHDGNFQQGLNYYEALFRGADKEKCIGEGSTTYSESWLERDRRSADRIHRYCRQAKIIYCVREPLSRIESNWLDVIWSLDIYGPRTELYVTKALQISGNFNDDIKANDGFVGTSNYWQRLQSYLHYFSSDQIKIVFFEEFRRSPRETIKGCFEFLEIDPGFLPDGLTDPRNPSSKKGLAKPLGRVARRLPGYQSIALHTPSPVKRLFQPLLKTPFSERPQWDQPTRQWAIQKLETDLGKFLDYCGKPLDFWDYLT